ncbi:Serine/threonine phosphatase stp [Sebaldella termitidis]|jgi:serine/threonine protein phosphatase PrpC|uniref:Protein serine/threonine phosphatase n=1 Tax=Sebaldella termitidis (strain ATCC 33386 / NCTC 11300) TaxID=526218 RepID=D1AH45_SEBTE|nr:SpoIIE family protein phosphatase [Sebaldella termitidis]ACZ08079.1 protein serine/threonine phosphatase [Sebaldella termitidis ATCC 33386]SUI23380.1 Serine/threonine phosphatase stp [Sebaldella termitidis]
MKYILVVLIILVIFIIIMLKKQPGYKDRGNLAITAYMENYTGRRKIQEDCMELVSFSKYEILGIIADGMGGFHNGKLASQFSVDRFVDLYSAGDLSVIEILKKINKEILSYSYNIGIENKVGTTFLAGEILYNRLKFFSVGDSSLFLFRKNKLERLNRHQEKKGYLTNYLGYSSFSNAENGEILLEKNDIVLMCSDGLDKFLSFDEIEDIMKHSKNKSSKRIVRKLMDALIEKKSGKQDNVSIIVIK